jgi:hypothetical protein
VFIRLNGASLLSLVQGGPAPTNPTIQVVTTHYDLNVGDYVELGVQQDSGVSLSVQVDVGSQSSPEFGMVKLP